MERIKDLIILLHIVIAITGFLFITEVHVLDRRPLIVWTGRLIHFSPILIITTAISLYGQSKYPKIVVGILGLLALWMANNVFIILHPFSGECFGH